MFLCPQHTQCFFHPELSEVFRPPPPQNKDRHFASRKHILESLISAICFHTDMKIIKFHEAKHISYHPSYASLLRVPSPFLSFVSAIEFPSLLFSTHSCSFELHVKLGWPHVNVPLGLHILRGLLRAECASISWWCVKWDTELSEPTVPASSIGRGRQKL